MPPAGESERLRPPGAQPSFGTFDGVAADLAAARDGKGGASASDAEADEAFEEDASPFAAAATDAELEVEISLLEHGRSIVVSHKVFSKPARPSARDIERAMHAACDTTPGGVGLSVPGIHTPIHPASLAVRIWTGYMLILTLTYVAFLEPIFIAFNTTLTNPTTAAVDFVSGAAFAFDLLVNFRTGVYYVCEGHVKLVLDARTIAAEYVRRYFLVDLLAAVPFFAQLAFYGIVLATGAPPATHSLLVTAMRAFRLLRVVRLWKLFISRRALLGMEIFVVHQTGTPLIIFGATVVYWFGFLVNLMACVFIFVATAETFCDSWVTQLAVPPDASSAVGASLDACGASLDGLVLPPGRDIYVTALYFATMTLTTVGYGDVVAKRPEEKGVVCAFMLVSAFFIATLTGQMVAVLAKHGDAHAAEQAFKDKMVSADRFVKDNGLPPAVQRQVLGWVQHAYMPHEARFSWRSELLEELPVAVRAEAVSAMVGDASLRDALRGGCADTRVWVAGRMQPRALHTGHYLCLAGEEATALYFTASGSLMLVAPGARVAATLPGRGHCLGGAAAAAALGDAPGGGGGGDDDGAAPRTWPLSVQAAVESNLFALLHADLRAALRMGALGTPGRSAAEETAAVLTSLVRVDAIAAAVRTL